MPDVEPVTRATGKNLFRDWLKDCSHVAARSTFNSTVLQALARQACMGVAAMPSYRVFLIAWTIEPTPEGNRLLLR
jgi:hypothetical protein